MKSESSATKTARPTSADVARLAGVDRSTVSIVLNGAKSSAGVSQEKRERIVKAAQVLGYRRNSSAAQMKSGRFNSISLVLGTNQWRTYFTPSLMAGILEEATRHDLHLNVARLGDEKLDNPNYVPKILRELMVDGLLIDYIYGVPEHMMKLIKQHRIPSIWLNSKHEFDCVYPDDEMATRQATQRLLELGHTRIAYVQHAHSEHYSTRDRLRGYVKAMNEARLEPHIYEPQVNPISDSQALVGQIASWLKGDNPPTAVVAYEDYFALPVLAATVHLGWRIPRDLSLIGIHDSVIGEPGFCISTMCLPAVEMGRVGVEMLHRKIEHPDEYLPARTLPLRWEPGLTCAPPSVRKVATR